MEVHLSPIVTKNVYELSPIVTKPVLKCHKCEKTCPRMSQNKLILFLGKVLYLRGCQI